MESKKINMEFLAAISHEIRNPLNILINLVHLLKEAATEEEKQTYIEGLVGTSHNLLELVNTIMDFSKLESGKLHYVYSPTDLKKSIQEHLLGHRTIAESKGLEFNIVMEETLPARVLADSVKLNQVILNLVSNAVKFTHEGSITVAVRPRSVSENQVVIQFEIKDTGKGIPPEKLKNIFEAFDQGSDEINLEFGGTGLGLSISEQVISHMGGQLEVQSELGFGTRFQFELPFEIVQAEEVMELAADQEDGSITAGTTVLIVDDSELNTLVMQKSLEGSGVRILTAQNGIGAIHVLQEHSVDLVLMDIHMPGMDGFEAVKVIKNLPQMAALPVIAVSGTTTPSLLSSLADSGFSGYVLKPFHPQELMDKVTAALRN